MEVTEKVGDLCAPLCQIAGVELLEVEFNGSTLRLVVDHPEGVGMDAIATVAREVSRTLDHVDPVKGRYTLEVSSPGLERRLERPDHFLRAIGSMVVLQTFLEGASQLKGTLEAADENGISVRTGHEEIQILRYAEIKKARTVFEWDSDRSRHSKGQQPDQELASEESETEK